MRARAPIRPPGRWWQKAQSGAAREKTLGGARAQVPVYRQQRPEDSKIGTQSAAKSGRPEQQRKHHWATAKQQGGAIQGGRGDGVTVGQTLSAGSVGAASQWRHLRAGWAAPLPVSPCASLCSLCCSAVAREAGAGRPVRPRHRVAGERRGVFLSDAAERGRGATFDNAPFQIRSRRKPAPSASGGCPCAACGAPPWPRESLGICFRSRRAPGDKPARQGDLF